MLPRNSHFSGLRRIKRLFLNPNLVNRLREEILHEVSIEKKYCKGQGDRKIFGIRVQEANKIIYIIHHTQPKAESLFALILSWFIVTQWDTLNFYHDVKLCISSSS